MRDKSWSEASQMTGIERLGQLEVETFLWSCGSAPAGIWRSWSSSAELSARGEQIQHENRRRIQNPAGLGGQRQQAEHLGHLGLLSQFGFASRLLPVDLVPVDPAPELVGKPGAGTQTAVSCGGPTGRIHVCVCV